MKKHNITLSIALAAVFSASTAFAEVEVTGKIIHESGFFSNSGSVIGADGTATHMNLGTATQGMYRTDTPIHSKGDAMKRETTARIYIDGEADKLSEGTTYHVELNLMTDGKFDSNYDSHESYTQRDALREAYIDTQVGDWSVRAGKQQVVWGTADGMKLLDMVNPTDYSEMAQNQMEDSRIPVWMFNAEKSLEDGGSVQVIVSQPKENIFAGLNRHIDTRVRVNAVTGTKEDVVINLGTDTGHAFMMKGPDTITGSHNGFLNIAPDLGGVAARFADGFGGLAQLSGQNMQGFTVGGFELMVMGGTNTSMSAAMNGRSMLGSNGTVFRGQAVTNTDYDTYSATYNYHNLPDAFQTAIVSTGGALGIAATDTTGLNAITGAQMLQLGFASQYDSNLADDKSDGVLDTAFDYMANTSFMTFDAFVGAGSQYVYNMPTDSEVDLAFKTSNSTKDGINYSLNASYNYDKNPIIDLSWRNAAGDKLAVNKMVTEMTTVGGSTPTGAMVTSANATSNYSLMLSDTAWADGVTSLYGEYGGYATEYANLRFSQEVKRVVNLGGSFDMAVETESLGPVVIRGEALYTKGAYSPVIDKSKLSYGDLVGALEMVKGDRMKFVLGADITALTNMMVSAQFIQDSNLDFVEGTDRYTADYATMHMSNGFNKAIKDKNFYSLFFSKPFGASGEHRWNNITMYEENGGKWNRLDAELSIDDNTQATVEYNKYWGNENTQFGQLEASSNIQLGVKYSF
jgi:hypothetical protein